MVIKADFGRVNSIRLLHSDSSRKVWEKNGSALCGRAGSTSGGWFCFWLTARVTQSSQLVFLFTNFSNLEKWREALKNPQKVIWGLILARAVEDPLFKVLLVVIGSCHPTPNAKEGKVCKIQIYLMGSTPLFLPPEVDWNGILRCQRVVINIEWRDDWKCLH